ncbi:MAG TPA: VOC family protein [Burkholderiales bacterium]|nr:VOC family protein [Burkholderiales bacterium]
MPHHLRIARPVSDLARATDMYCRGPGLRVIGRFEDHAGFDGVMLGAAGADYHLEFTYCRNHVVQPTPTAEDLIVFYLPSASEWHAACERMLAAGFEQVAPFNPYWDLRGRTFQDRDGYRVVLQREDWSNRQQK